MSSSLTETIRIWNDREARQGVPPEHRSFAREAHGSAGMESRGVLLLHGGGGSPLDLVALADDLTVHGFSILCPLLPAHGLGEEALSAFDFHALVERALDAHDALARAHGAPVAVVALSLGAVLGVRVAARRRLVAFVALAPALRPFVGRRVVQVALDAILRPRLARLNWKWQQAARRGIQATVPEITQVTAPILVMHSHDDPSVSPRGAHLLHDRAMSKVKRLVLLEDQGHVLTRAPDLESVFGPVREFLREAFERQASGRSNTNDGS